MLRRILVFIGALLGVLILLIALLHFYGSRRLTRAPGVEVAAVTIPTDAASVERGQHLVRTVSECIGCHGENLEGQVFIDEAPIGYVAAPNLTRGAGGIGGEMSDEEWVSVFYHGIGHDGRTLFIMPSQWYQHYSPEDLGAVIAYLKQIPPVDNELGQRAIAFPGTIFLGVLGYGALPFNLIDHDRIHAAAPPEGATTTYGQYLVYVAGCGDCHGSNYAGAQTADVPQGVNITPGGNLGQWTEEQFIQTIRTGERPDGHRLDPEQMPWQTYAKMSDTELAAIYAYLSSLEPLPTNEY